MISHSAHPHYGRFPNSNIYKAHNDELVQLYNKNKFFPRIMINIYLLALLIFTSIFLSISNVYAVEKIEGGNITIDSLGTIIKQLATKVQIFGIILSFIALVVFVIQFIIGDDETKQRRKKTILYTLGGVVLLILVPSIINFIIDTLK